ARLAPAVPQGADVALAIARSAAPADRAALMPAVGAGIVGSWQPDSFAPGGRIDATLGASTRSARLRLSFAGLGNHTMKVRPGQANWWRAYLVIGGDYVLPVGGR